MPLDKDGLDPAPTNMGIQSLAISIQEHHLPPMGGLGGYARGTFLN
jgi:hypothetical protein